MGPLGLPELLVLFVIFGLIAIGVVGFVIVVVTLNRRRKTTPPR